jgi:hypothetical protein
MKAVSPTPRFCHPDDVIVTLLKSHINFNSLQFRLEVEQNNADLGKSKLTFHPYLLPCLFYL